METTLDHPRTGTIGAGHVAAAALAAWLLYVLVGGMDGIGRHFVVLGALRVVLFGALLAFALAAGAHERRLGQVGLVLAGLGALVNLVGGIGSVTTDGWSFDVFGAEGPADPPWYAYVIGLSGFLFALGTVLVGLAGRAAGRIAAAVVLAGVLFPAVFVLQDVSHAVGHIVWLAPWGVLAAWLAAAEPRR